MKANDKFTEIVRHQLDVKGLKHVAVARQVGLTPASFSAKLCGRAKWSVDEVMRVSKVLDIPTTELL